MDKEGLEAVLNKLPEVQWDRMTIANGVATVFGWLERADNRADFVSISYIDEDSYTFTTSSDEWSEEFTKRLYPDAPHIPCQRVEDVLDVRAVRLADPMDAGGDIVGIDDPHAMHGQVIKMGRAVMVDAMAVVAIHIPRGEEDETVVGVMLEGDINQSDPREHARVLNIMGWEEAAGLIAELQALANRAGITDEFRRLLERRWGQLKEEGAT